MTTAEVLTVIAEWAASGRLGEIAIGLGRTPRVIAEGVLALEARVLRTLRRLHSVPPRPAPIVRDRVASALADLGNDVLVDAIIDRLAARGRVTVGA